MGVDISSLIEPRQIEIADLAYKKIAVDALNTIYQFVATIRDRFTGEPLRDSNGNVTSHLSGLFYRNLNLLKSNIQPIYVFDGEPPEFKKETSEARNAIRVESEKKWKEALEKGEIEKVKTYAQGASRVTKEMIEDSKQLLKAMGIPCIQAPSEAEAQCAHFCSSGQVYAAASQDFDSLMFGAPRLIRNLNVTGRRKVPKKEKYIEVKPEMIELNSVLKTLGLNRKQLIVLGMLIGTDYNPGGIKGIGPKTALKLVKENKTLDRVLKKVEWNFRTPSEKIFRFIESPPVKRMDIPKERLELKKVIDILTSHDFSEERVRKGLEGLGGGQTGLSGFLDHRGGGTSH